MRRFLLFVIATAILGCRRDSSPTAARITIVSVSPLPASGAAASFTPAAAVPPTPTATIYHVGGDVTEPVEITRTMPHIPDSMQRGVMKAPPMFEAIIGIDGSVSGVHSLRPVPEQARECMAILASQLSQWRYKPATLKGKPVPVYLTVTFFHRSC